MKSTTLACGLLLLVGGCVPQGKYALAVAHTETTRAELGKLAGDLGRTKAELARTNLELESARAEAQRLESLVEETTGAADRLSRSNAARIAELRTRVDELKVTQAAAERRSRPLIAPATCPSR